MSSRTVKEAMRIENASDEEMKYARTKLKHNA